MKLILIISLVFTLTACVSLPKSSQELQTKSTTRYQFNVNRDLDVVERNFDEFLDKCYYTLNNAKIYLNHAQVGVDQGFDKSKNGNHIKYSIYGGLSPKNYVLDLDLTKAVDSSSVRVDVVAVTGMWKRHFPKYERVANGEKESCPW